MPVPSAPPEENKAAGIALAVTAFALFSFMDTVVKLLSAHYSVPQIIFVNSCFSLAVVMVYAARRGGVLANIRTRRPGLHLVRALCGVTSGFLSFYAYSRMPIADVYALAFAAPLFITALSIPLLKEQVGWRRWTAVAVGFVGILVMLRPGTGVIDPAAFAALGGTLAYATGMLISRMMRGTETAISFAFYSPLAAVIVTGAMMPFLFVVPTLGHLALAGLAGALSGLALIALINAFRRSPAAVVAPFQYTQMIWGVLAGLVLFDTKPDLWLAVGGGIVIGSGLYILHREVVRGQAVALTRPPV